MPTEIREPIRVGAVFDRTRVIPAWFIWGGRRYPVLEVTQWWQTREGQAQILHLGVTDGANCFELAFNQQALTWQLVSADAEGNG